MKDSSKKPIKVFMLCHNTSLVEIKYVIERMFSVVCYTLWPQYYRFRHHPDSITSLCHFVTIASVISRIQELNYCYFIAEASRYLCRTEYVKNEVSF